MTQTRSWLALGALLVAIVGGTVWAQHEKPSLPADLEQSPTWPATDKKCCDEKCGTKEEAKSCCEAKCCTAATEKAKGCCADGKCCGCCEKAKESRTVSVPVPAGAAVQVTVEPAGVGGAYDMPFAPPPVPCVSAPCPAYNSSTWGATVPQAVQPTPPLQYTPVAQSLGTPCAPPPPPMPARSVLSPWRMQVVVQNNQPRLMMQWYGDQDTRVSCEELVLHVGGESLKLAASDKQVVVSGKFVKGRADAISRNPDGSLLLEGHVKMHYGKEAKKVEVTAEDVVVGLTDGRVVVRGLDRAASPEPLTDPVPIRPTSATPTSCPSCPGTGCDAVRAFHFWLGLFH
jgi:hypothetical protein